MRAHALDPAGSLVDTTIETVSGTFVGNTRIDHVLAKVVVLNSLYFTNILGVRDVAAGIVAAEVDPLFEAGKTEVLEILADHVIGGKARNHFSFATKYAHWIRPDAYPIYDSFVQQQLRAYQRQDRFALFRSTDLRSRQFPAIIDEFRSYYGLDACSYRAIDKWLWRQGKGLAPAR